MSSRFKQYATAVLQSITEKPNSITFGYPGRYLLNTFSVSGNEFVHHVIIKVDGKNKAFLSIGDPEEACVKFSKWINNQL